MEDRKAKVLALFCGVAGLLALYLLSPVSEQSMQPAKISGLGLDDVGSSEKVCGNITGKAVKGGHVFFKLDDGSSQIGVVAFNGTAAKLAAAGTDLYSMPEKSFICAFGQLQEYPPGTGTLELIAKKVAL